LSNFTDAPQLNSGALDSHWHRHLRIVRLRQPVDDDDEFLRQLGSRSEVRDRLGGLNYRKIPRGYFRLVEIDGKPAGVVAIAPSRILGADDFEISCVLLEEYENNGVATEGCAMLIDEYPSPAPPARLLAGVKPDNPAGVRVAEKLGFRRLDEPGAQGEVVLEYTYVDPAV